LRRQRDGPSDRLPTITSEPTYQHLAEGFPVAMRFHSASIIRLADDKPLQLGHVARADGAGRLYVFADGPDPASPDSRARRLREFLASEKSPLARFTPAGADPDSVIDVRAVVQQGHRDLAVEALPTVLRPRKGRFGLVDQERVFCPDPKAGDVFDLGGSTATPAAWSSCAPTSTSRTCFPWTRTRSSPTSSPGAWSGRPARRGRHERSARAEPAPAGCDRGKDGHTDRSVAIAPATQRPNAGATTIPAAR
jgi:hypothetical protein